MEYLLSALYSSVDSICLLVFLSAFASQRFTKIKQGFIASLYILSVCTVSYTHLTLPTT